MLAWLGLGLGFGLGLGSGLGLRLGLGNVVLAVEEEQALAHVLPQEREGVRRLQARVELSVDQQLGRGSGRVRG